MRYQNNGRSTQNGRRGQHHRLKKTTKNYYPKVSPLRHTFDSNGPSGRLRGTATQLIEKYINLAREAQGDSNLVLMESFYQHADHYQRLIIDYQEYEQQQKENRKNRLTQNQQEYISDDDDTTQNANESDDEEDFVEAGDITSAMPSFLNQSATSSHTQEKPNDIEATTQKIDSKKESDDSAVLEKDNVKAPTRRRRTVKTNLVENNV